MNQLQRKILLVTDRPSLVAGFYQLLDSAGMGNQFAIASPTELLQVVPAEEACLVMVDAEPSLEWEELMEVCRSRPSSLFVLWCSRVTPELALSAVEAGVHGLLSTGLPLHEASLALVKISQGERYFRFEPDLNRRAAGATRSFAASPFDESWMFSGINRDARK
ncbi:MAG: hypothetical protein C5B51_29060 [Terriglobia bacterium]|nr:MAG: hypothetical protein C5B51_29060 [Terriglobia bacterium]